MRRPTNITVGIAGLLLSAALTILPAATLATAVAPPKPVTNTAQNGAIVDKSGTDSSVPGKEYAIAPKTGNPALQAVLGRFGSILVGISGSVGLLVFVWAGITMITSDGDAKKVDTAKRMMIWTAIGLAVIFTAEPLIRAVLNALLSGSVA